MTVHLPASGCNTTPSDRVRAGKRVNAFLVAFVTGEAGTHPVRLRNISEAGALVEAEAGFALGARVVFRRAFAVLDAQVVWCRGGRYGLLFDRPLPTDDVAALSRRILAGARAPVAGA